ncbi:hypothetical protein [Reyranella sp.]|uniref:hypothetical protein n=1 Tax=Reyranella sp. TaxID=1929291 RepID=UPI003D123E02
MDQRDVESRSVESARQAAIELADRVVAEIAGGETEADAATLRSSPGPDVRCRESERGTLGAVQASHRFHRRAIVDAMIGEIEREAGIDGARLMERTGMTHQLFDAGSIALPLVGNPLGGGQDDRQGKSRQAGMLE